MRATPYTNPPSVVDSEVEFYCEDCKINFTVNGYIEGDRDNYEVIVLRGQNVFGMNVYCPNDKASDDYDNPTHDISLESGQ